MKYLFVILNLMISLGLSTSPEPVPTCTVPDVRLKELPISLK